MSILQTTVPKQWPPSSARKHSLGQLCKKYLRRADALRRTAHDPPFADLITHLLSRPVCEDGVRLAELVVHQGHDARQVSLVAVLHTKRLVLVRGASLVALHRPARQPLPGGTAGCHEARPARCTSRLGRLALASPWTSSPLHSSAVYWLKGRACVRFPFSTRLDSCCGRPGGFQPSPYYNYCPKECVLMTEANGPTAPRLPLLLATAAAAAPGPPAASPAS